MGINILIPLLIGISLSIMLASQIGSKVIETIKVGKIESKVIDTQDVIFEATKRYITMMQKFPKDINELIDLGFLAGKYNDNGFGGNFEISIDEIKKILNVYTSIEDERAQTIFLNSMKNKFIPKKEGINDFVTSFVLPKDLFQGNGLFMVGVPIQKLAPDKTKHKYWYDTSNGEAILKIFDGKNWVMVKGNSSEENSPVPNYKNIANHFASSIQGDRKYTFDSNTNTIVEFVYNNKQWEVYNPKSVNESKYTLINAQKYRKNNKGNLVLATVDCYGFPIGKTIKVEGIEYLVVGDGTGTYGIKNETNKARASTLCTSNVTDMSSMNFDYSFNEDISKWDTSNVQDMSSMFSSQFYFNQPLNNWDTSKVTNMESMFSWNESFNQPLNDWDVSKVTNMKNMFLLAKNFNQPLNNWNVSNVINMHSMFSNAVLFNQPLNDWNVSKVTNMRGMFQSATLFNQPLNNWNVSNVQNIGSMFYYAKAFNQPLNNWNVSKVINMEEMFRGASSFNQPLNNWNTSKVIDMSSMFNYASSFNQNINSWDTSKVTNMSSMFYNAVLFNQPLNDWNVSKVTSFGTYYHSSHFSYGMFYGATSFNQPLNNWIINTTSNVDMTAMFYNASSFNQNISNWNVSKVTKSYRFDTGATKWNSIYKPKFK